MGAQGSMIQDRTANFGGNIQTPAGGWWTAFGTGGFEGEPPLLEGASSVHLSVLPLSYFTQELGINFSHIRAKSLTVLNPLSRIDEHIMDDADLAGPVFVCFCFATCLLFVSELYNIRRIRSPLTR
jgi:hypothetical protein